MKVSFRNWLVGATEDVNTIGAFNTESCTSQYTGDPFAWSSDTGTLAWDLGASRRIRAVAFLNYHCPTSATVKVRIRSGGSGGSIVYDYNFSFFEVTGSQHHASSFDSLPIDVTGDYVEIVGISSGPGGYLQVGRFWVGDALPITLGGRHSLQWIDTSIIEESQTGEEFFTEQRVRYEINVPSIDITDNLVSGASATDGDYEDWFDALHSEAMEVFVFAHDEFNSALVHGRLDAATFTKGAGPIHTLAPFRVRGF